MTALETLDLRQTGISCADYDALHAALPNCDIHWDVPFAGDLLDSRSEQITVGEFTADDLTSLGYLPALSTIDATACTDIVALTALRTQFPECELICRVTVDGKQFPNDASELTLSAITADEVATATALMPNLTTITLTEVQEDPAAVLDLMYAYPEIHFHWQTEILGVNVDSDATFLDFSNIEVTDLEAFESIISRLPSLEQVDMCYCGISNEEMDALNKRHENIKFVWMLEFTYKCHVRTDEDGFIPGIYDFWIDDNLAQLLTYMNDLVALDLGHHYITNIEFVRNMPKLKYLIIGDTAVSDLTPLEDTPELIYFEMFLTDVTDYSPLLKLKKLESLNICFTGGDVNIIAQMPWLKYLRWARSAPLGLTGEQLQMLSEKLPDTYIETSGASATGGKWRDHQNYYDMRDVLNMYYMTG